MATKNDITGDSIQSRVSSSAYKDNYDAIFGKKSEKLSKEIVTEKEEKNDQAV